MAHNQQSLVETPAKAGAQPKTILQPWQTILIALAWPMIGFLFVMVYQMVTDMKVPKLIGSIVNLAVCCFGAFYLFPKVYRSPFGGVAFKEYLTRLGFYLPKGAWRHIVLGVILAVCTLSGMLGASVLSGRYTPDWANINIAQLVFSLGPGIFEEFFYRGVIMIVLLGLTKSLKKSMIGQIAIFGVAHIKGLDVLSFIDAFSVAVIAIAFTFAAWKTRTLVAGIVFHYLHDAFLYFVQPPDATYIGVKENVIFYALLWLMVGVGCLIIWFASERLGVRAERELYEEPAV